MAPTLAGLDPVKPHVRHPRLAPPSLVRCQTPLNSLISGDDFGNYVRVTDSEVLGQLEGPSRWQHRYGGWP